MKKIIFALPTLAYILGATTPMAMENYPEDRQQIIGTQAIGGAYHFTKDDKVLEQAKRTLEMGSHMVKTRASDSSAVLKLPFDTYFFWWNSDSKRWKDGLSESDKNAEYKETYNFAQKLLIENADKKRTFFLGHWEGDWYLLPDYKADGNADQKRLKGMTDWLNIRQKAVDDARRDVGLKSLSKIYHYTEVNRVRDAMVYKKDRLVNKVLPNTNVDYVSYSSYDVQKESVETIKDTLNYIAGNIKPKDTIKGPRVFIGECGLQAKHFGYDPQRHEKANRDILVKFLTADVPYILYWQMYNNEVKDGKQEGFWLINDKNEKQPLYHTLENLYKAQKEFKDIRKESREWLMKK